MSNPEPDPIRDLQERISEMEKQLREQADRIGSLERQLASSARTDPPAQPSPDDIALAALARRSAPPRTPRARPTTAPPSTTEPRQRRDLESLVGGSWFNRIGIVAICFGVAFFLKYAFDNGWIGPTARVILGVLLGLGFLVGGELLRRRRYENYAAGITGGGILILYLSVYASSVLYDIVPRLPAFGMMALVTATASVLAARYRMLPIALVGLAGGFMTPVLLSTGENNAVGLFSYIALLDIGVLALAYRQGWRVLHYVAFVATAVIFGGWMARWYDESALWMTVGFLTLFFVVFTLVSLLQRVVAKRDIVWSDLVLVVANSLLYFATTFILVDQEHHELLGGFDLVMSALHLLLAIYASRQLPEERGLHTSYLLLSILYLVVAVPTQLEEHWMTIGWSVVGAAVAYVATRFDSSTGRMATLPIYLLAAMRWWLGDMAELSQIGPWREGAQIVPFTPFANAHDLSSAILIASLALAAWLCRSSSDEKVPASTRLLGGAYLLAANGVLAYLLVIDIVAWIGAQELFGPDSSERTWELQAMAAAAILSLHGLVLFAAGTLRRSDAARVGGVTLLGMSVAALLVRAETFTAWWHGLVLNPSFGGFTLAAACFGGAYVIDRRRRDKGEPITPLSAGLLIAANLLFLVALSGETYGLFARRMGTIYDMGSPEMANELFAQRLSLSLVWIVYGGAMLAAGLVRSNRVLRIMALALLALATLKVFLFDLSTLERLYRIISFIVLGAILLGVSFLYQRTRPAARDDG